MGPFENVKRSREVEVDNTLKEVMVHDSFLSPIAVYLDEFNLYSTRMIQRHWHEECQFHVVLRGNVEYGVNDETIMLSQGEGIFINSNILHMSNPAFAQDSVLFSVLFKSSVIGDINYSSIESKYVLPVLKCSELSYFPLYMDITWHKQILELLKELFDAECKQEFGWELEVKNCLCNLWLILVNNAQYLLISDKKRPHPDDYRIKQMLQYIHKHYAERITLLDISSAASISVSECCRCFRRVLGITPFEYLIHHRIEQAAKMLIATQRSIAEITNASGFNGISYFHKIFRQFTGFTPFKYREQHLR